MNPRFLWALEILQIKPTDEVLEIGCGVGIMVEEIAKKLSEGSITAVDRSAAMVKMAAKRIKQLSRSEKIKLIVSDFEKLDLKESKFDICFSFNVSLFFKNSTKALDVVKRQLKADGVFYQFYQPATDNTSELCEKAIAELIKNEFSIERVIIEKKLGIPVFCVVSKPR